VIAHAGLETPTPTSLALPVAMVEATFGTAAMP
jgi:hypothetical protein